MLLRACKEESVRKPILRDSNGKAIGRGSFWRREPFDYSDYERDLPQGDYDRIRSQDLTVADRILRDEADDISVQSSDWRFRTGNKRFNVKWLLRDPTFDALSKEKKLKLYYSKKRLKYFTKRQAFQIELEINGKKEEAKRLLEEKKKTLEEVKKRSRSQSRSESNEPPSAKLKARTTKKHE